MLRGMHSCDWVLVVMVSVRVVVMISSVMFRGHWLCTAMLMPFGNHSLWVILLLGMHPCDSELVGRWLCMWLLKESKGYLILLRLQPVLLEPRDWPRSFLRDLQAPGKAHGRACRARCVALCHYGGSSSMLIARHASLLVIGLWLSWLCYCIEMIACTHLNFMYWSLCSRVVMNDVDTIQHTTWWITDHGLMQGCPRSRIFHNLWEPLYPFCCIALGVGLGGEQLVVCLSNDHKIATVQKAWVSMQTR